VRWPPCSGAGVPPVNGGTPRGGGLSAAWLAPPFEVECAERSFSYGLDFPSRATLGWGMGVPGETGLWSVGTVR
jgi:hypothetical protein